MNNKEKSVAVLFSEYETAIEKLKDAKRGLDIARDKAERCSTVADETAFCLCKAIAPSSLGNGTSMLVYLGGNVYQLTKFNDDQYSITPWEDEDGQE